MSYHIDGTVSDIARSLINEIPGDQHNTELPHQDRNESMAPKATVPGSNETGARVWDVYTTGWDHQTLQSASPGLFRWTAIPPPTNTRTEQPAPRRATAKEDWPTGSMGSIFDRNYAASPTQLGAPPDHLFMADSFNNNYGFWPAVDNSQLQIPQFVSNNAIPTIQPTIATAPVQQVIPAVQPITNGRRLGYRPTRGPNARQEYEWSTGHKRVWLELTHRGAPLPAQAVSDYWNHLSSQCTHEHADIRLLGGLHITVVELLVFFPEHIKWRAINQRLGNGGWSAGLIRQFIFWSRQFSRNAHRAIGRSSMGHLSSRCKAWADVRVNGRRINEAAGWSMGNISTERSMVGPMQYTDLTDYFLVDLAEGVVQFPQGADRGLLTVAVEHALQNRHNTFKLSDFARYVASEQLVLLTGVAPTRTGNVVADDTAARQRHFGVGIQPTGAIQTWWKHLGHVQDGINR